MDIDALNTDYIIAYWPQANIQVPQRQHYVTVVVVEVLEIEISPPILFLRLVHNTVFTSIIAM
jgi:hypothetical protein